jgi:hypothetical protein
MRRIVREDNMRGPAALFPIAFALGAIILVPAQAKDAEGGPIEIDKCQTISQPGSYKLVNDLTITTPGGTCLPITTSLVTIDLAGFTITKNGGGQSATAILGPQNGFGITVRNGSIAGFSFAVQLLSVRGSIVEGLRITGCGRSCAFGITATGIVKGNIVSSLDVSGISAAGVITGNYVSNTAHGVGFQVGAGSTVLGNTATGNFFAGFEVGCPSNVTDNTAVNNLGHNLILNGEGCNNTNNVAP